MQQTRIYTMKKTFGLFVVCLIICSACQKTFTITVSSNNGNYGTVSGGGLYVKGAEITIKAFPKEGYSFKAWNDSNTNNPRTLKVENDAIYTAIFVPNENMVTINVCSDNENWGTTIGSGTYTKGTSVQILAIPNGGCYFQTWNDGNRDNPRTISATDNATYIATFAIVQIGVAPIDSLIRNMVKVEGGTFLMGATSDDDLANDNEMPQHSVTLSDFYICKYEVTQELWQAVMGSVPKGDYAWTSAYGKGQKYPAYYVSWADCDTFIQRLNAKTGLHFRLPTEAEWEYAAKGGNKSRQYTYAGSNTISNVAWGMDNSNGATHNVMQKTPNELGLYDMSGNVYEWCSDWYSTTYYSESGNTTNPQGAISGNAHVYRGGSRNAHASRCRVTYRTMGTPTIRYNDLGFRVALQK